MSAVMSCQAVRPARPKIVRTGRVAVSAQVDGVDDEALGGQESGEPVVSSAVLADAVSDLHQCAWADPAGRQPLPNEYRSLIDLRGEREGVRNGGGLGAHASPVVGRRA